MYAFLQSFIDQPTFGKQADGYEVPGPSPGKPLVMKLEYAIYGSHTASQPWCNTFDKALTIIDSEPTTRD